MKVESYLIMSHPLLQVDRLSVTFQRDGMLTTPVRDVSLTVQAGERVAVVGEN
ncbi:MAG TPA: hypothetical protein P5527_11590 [Kiritimatiellia bacterium]|nr:hypothetical protein [Kiritimatiellia bacterium]